MIGKLAPSTYGFARKKKNRIKSVTLICKECGEEFQVFKYEKDTRKYCSRTCASRNYNRTRTIDRGTRKCEYCGEEFKVTANKNVKHCSKKCSAINRCEKQMKLKELSTNE